MSNLPGTGTKELPPLELVSADFRKQRDKAISDFEEVFEISLRDYHLPRDISDRIKERLDNNPEEFDYRGFMQALIDYNRAVQDYLQRFSAAINREFSAQAVRIAGLNLEVNKNNPKEIALRNFALRLRNDFDGTLNQILPPDSEVFDY